MALKPKPDSFTSYGMGDECFCSFCRKAFTIESSEEALFGECPECISAKLDDVSYKGHDYFNLQD
jgi:hypothetical protein